jgi:hypothetical protein
MSESNVATDTDIPASATDLRVEVLRWKVECASRLQDDWDSYGAAPPNRDAVRWAQRALNLTLAEWELPSTVVPSADGGIALCWDAGSRHAYIEFDNDGTAIVAMYVSVESPSLSEFEPTDAAILLEIGNIQRFMRV